METTLPKKIERSPETHEPVSGNAGTAMKISNDTINTALQSTRNEPLEKKGRTAPSVERTRGQAGDRVELSVNLRDIDRLTATAASMPGASAEKIESLRNRIADGTYKVSGLAVAEKMLSSMGIEVTGGDE
jgi:flagellar biosynthesis anti-sigma factor FlgM